MIAIQREEPKDDIAMHYAVRIHCRNCDTAQWAVIEKGKLADIVRSEMCVECCCKGELRKAVTR